MATSARSISARSSGGWIDRAIKITIVLIVAVGVSLGGLYGYNYYMQKKELPINDATLRLEQQVRESPLNVNLRVSLGAAYVDQKRYGDAIEQFNEALKLDKENQGAIVFMGVAFMKDDRPDRALQAFNKEIAMYGGNAGYKGENKYLEMAYYNSAAIYWEQAKYSKAEEMIGQALTIRRTDSDNYFLQGRIFLSQKKFEEAGESFLTALEFDPLYPDAHYGLGVAYERTGQYGKAVARYYKAKELAPDFKPTAQAYERLFTKVKERAEAQPSNVDRLFELGIAYVGTNQEKLAIKQFEKILEIKPEYAMAQYGIGLAYRGLRKYKKALEYFNKALIALPKNKEIRITRDELAIQMATKTTGEEKELP